MQRDADNHHPAAHLRGGLKLSMMLLRRGTETATNLLH